jgi:hypothetical protein
MKDQLLQLYQQRLDKCTTEQFWAVALLGTLCGFVLLHRDAFSPVPLPLVGVAVAFTALVAAAYVYTRHRIYLFYDGLLVDLLREEGLGAGLLHPRDRSRTKQAALLSGVLFYLAVSLGMGLGTAYACIFA